MTKTGFAVTLILFFAFRHYSISQDRYKTDSLLQELASETRNDVRYQLSLDLAYYHYDPGEALKYSRIAYDLAASLGNRKGQAQSLELAAQAHRILGNYQASYEAIFQSLSVANSLPDKNIVASLQFLLGSNYTVDGQFKLAVRHLENALTYYLDESIWNRSVLVYINLGEAYRLSNQLDSAEMCFKQALSINDSIQDQVIEAYATGNLGMVHRSQGRLNEAERELQTAVEMLTELGDPASVVVYRAEIGQLYLSRGDFRKGIELIDDSYREAKGYHLKEQIRDLSKMLMDAYQGAGMYDKGFYYQNEYHQYKDSLVNVENVRQIEQTKARYELDKRDSDIELKDAELAKQAAQNQTILVIALLLIIILVAIYIAYRLKSKSNQLLADRNQVIEEQAKEKELLYREMHHRVKNNLQLISSIMGLNAQESSDEVLSQELISGKSRMEAMTLIHESLYGEQANAQVKFREYLDKLLENLKVTYHGQINELTFDSPDITLLADDSIPIGLIINECICNSVKYQPASGISVHVSFEPSENTGYRLVIKDTGTGFRASDVKKGFGTKLLSTLASQLRASLTLNMDDGTKYTLEIPELMILENKKPMIG